LGIFSVIFLILDVILGVSIFVYYIINFKEVNSYFKYGAVLIGIICILELISGALGMVNIALSGVIYLKSIIMVCIGIHLSSKTGQVDIPLIKKLFRKGEGETINVRNYIISTAAVILGSVIFSYVLFKLTSPSMSQMIKKNLLDSTSFSELTSAPTFQVLIELVAISIAEEITFRFVIQNYVAKIFKLEGKKYWIAIVFAAFIWALAHGNTLDPEWVKFAQIFPIGIALGGLYKKYGLESSMFAHAGFNVIMSFFAVGLIRM